MQQELSVFIENIVDILTTGADLNNTADEIAKDYLAEVESQSWFLREIEFSDGVVDEADDDCFDPYAGEYNAEYFYYC
jgi:hypothetical protein